MRTINKFSVIAVLLASLAVANAQFKITGPAPYTEPVARQKIKALLGKLDPAERQETIQAISGLLTWYRDIFDDELIGAWQRNEARENLTAAMKPLADARIASAIIEFSWHKQRPATFTLAFAPMFVDLMARSPDAAQPFFDDLLASNNNENGLNLSQSEMDSVCRILLDLPDVRTWRKNALRILPHYQSTADFLLKQDLRSDNEEKRNLAQVWRLDLRLDSPAPTPGLRRRLEPSSSVPASSTPPDRTPNGNLLPPAGAVDTSQAPASAITPPPAPRSSSRPTILANAPYDGPTSGKLECSGGPIPQNAEYVFRNIPNGNLQLDFDTKTWEARLTPGDGQTQKLILKNKSSGPQKRCTVRWSIVP